MTVLPRSLWPWSPTWRRAVSSAGHCVMARLLDLKVTRLDFDPAAGGVVEWAHASAAYPALRVAPVPRGVAETDALVALAGGVALWLYAAPEVTADDIRAGDVVAEEFLLDVFDQWFVVPDWREYLRSRALSMLNPTEQKAVIAWLAVRLVERGSVRAGAVYDLVDEARELVQPYLAFHRHIDDYISLFGPPPFPQPLDVLQLPADVVDALHARDVVSFGQLLSQTPADLALVPGLDGAGVSAIRRALAGRWWGWIGVTHRTRWRFGMSSGRHARANGSSTRRRRCAHGSKRCVRASAARRWPSPSSSHAGLSSMRSAATGS